ncbi:MAG: DUF1801 domain-containing protein [Parvularculaceae bacterium]|nr:DUF1801 domain-containing protein [Parvularculaceae bacterium]
MAKSKSRAKAGGVDDFMAALDHPHKDGVDRLRRAIKGADSRIEEEIKWNAPSFKLAEHFVTFKLHPPTAIALVFHTGAKPLAAPRKFALDDPHKLLKWAAQDRCVLTLKSADDARKYEKDVVAMVRAWIRQLEE